VRLDTDAFYSLLRREYRTIVGPGHWFEMDDRYLRIGFGYPEEAAMREGLTHIEEAAGRAEG
jgi:DNA-binding transcriptional MocR family regulator